MKHLAALLALTPGFALAHGAHAPVPEAAHGMAHVLPVLLIAGLGVAAVWWMGRRS